MQADPSWPWTSMEVLMQTLPFPFGGYQVDYTAHPRRRFDIGDSRKAPGRHFEYACRLGQSIARERPILAQSLSIPPSPAGDSCWPLASFGLGRQCISHTGTVAILFQ